MKSEDVLFYSQGKVIRGLWRSESTSVTRLRAIVQGPGWFGLKDAKLYERYHHAFTQAGFGVLVFDYRGFGESEGEQGRVSLADQIVDLRSAVTYLQTREDVDDEAIAAFGSGGTGGGNAVILAALDQRIRAVVCQVPVADGADWLHRMRSEDAWIGFLARLEQDRRVRARSGCGELVDPRREIVLPSAERLVTTVKSDVDERVPRSVSFEIADELLEYRPVDFAQKLRTPLLVIGVEGDATTPTDHAIRLFDAAMGPKELVLQRHTSHYEAYDKYWEVVTPQIVKWLDEYTKGRGTLTVKSALL
jgi:dipeptidyl aminopeptidase/acylaminoacyl peptidase